MRKAATVFVLITSLVWHAFAMADLALGGDHGSGLAHAALHIEHESHHHHSDGSIHQDGSDESMQHVSADGCVNVTGAVSTYFPTALPGPASAGPCAGAQRGHDSPVLEGPRRPPRLTA